MGADQNVKKPNILSRLFGSLLLSAELCAAADVALALSAHPAPVRAALPVFAALTLAFFFGFPRRRKAVWTAAAVTAATATVFALTAGGIWFRFYTSSVYEDARSFPSEPFFSGKNVMLIVPHQDDDLNLLAGSIEEYIAGGSELRVVFTTNGDYDASHAALRMEEAVHTLGSCGVPEENVIFLGYGDSWKGPVHLYNAPGDQVLESRAGFTAVHGTEAHPAWNEGNAYTRSNFISDLKDVILSFRPDVIFCVDCDHHDDHIAASLFFDRAMGQIKKETPDYCPRVYKGFAYGTAYYAEDDFYALNILSSVPPFDSLGISPQGAYRWADRVRLPVAPSSLSRSLLSCGIREKLRMYASQTARFHAGRIVNGDKVFWERETAALSFSAHAVSGSGDASRLNDFMLCDTSDVGDPADIFHAGAWIPEKDDPEKSAELIFDGPVKIDRLCFYDNPSLSDNILEAEVTLKEYPENARAGESGKEITFLTGPLDPDGHCTEICPDIPGGMEFGCVSVKIIRSEGERAGLTELEVYGGEEPDTLYPAAGTDKDSFVKIMDQEENFVYDYILSSGEAAFGLYGYRCSAKVEDYEISCTGSGCSAYPEDGKITVKCPRGKTCVLTVTAKSPGAGSPVSDSVIIRGADPMTRLGQDIEAFVYRHYADLRETAIYTLLRDAYHLLGGETIIL